MDIIDDLQRDGLVIVRSDSRFAYGHDAVLLTDFVRAHAGERYLDIGTGTGILAILTYVELNKLGEHISVEQCDARTLTEAEFGRFDGAVCNPPYFSGGTKSPNQSRATSAFDDTLNIYEAAQCAKRVVKQGGRFFVCYPAKYIQQLCTAMQQADFAIKRLCLVQSRADKAPYLALAEGRKGGGAGTELSRIILEEQQ